MDPRGFPEAEAEVAETAPRGQKEPEPTDLLDHLHPNMVETALLE